MSSAPGDIRQDDNFMLSVSMGSTFVSGIVLKGLHSIRKVLYENISPTNWLFFARVACHPDRSRADHHRLMEVPPACSRFTHLGFYGYGCLWSDWHQPAPSLCEHRMQHDAPGDCEVPAWQEGWRTMGIMSSSPDQG